MPSDVYSVTSLAMRYWFVFLGVVIVIRAYAWLFRDRREKHARLRRMPDSGMIGALVVMKGVEGLEEGEYLTVPWEGTLGSARGCDVVIPSRSVARIHAYLSFSPRYGVLVEPASGHMCTVDGAEINCRSRREDHPLRHGSLLEVGDCVLRMRFYAGLDTAHQASFLDEEVPLPGQKMSGDIPSASPWPVQEGAYEPQQTPEKPVGASRKNGRQGRGGALA